MIQKTQTVSITVNGTSETNNIISVSATNILNRAYNVATLTSARKFVNGDTVFMTLGDYTFNGFVHNIQQSSKNTYDITLRTQNAKLTTPYTQSEEVIENATNSTELWNLYNTEHGTNIVSTETDVYFGANFKRSGTIVNAIDAVCKVTGAEYYDSGTSLVISPHRDISTKGAIIHDYEIFDFISYSDDYENNNVSTVIINDSVSSQSASVSVEFDGMEVYLYPNNIATLTATKGLSADFTSYNYYPLIKHKEISKTSQIDLKTAVHRIDKVTVNGTEIGYTHESGSNIVGFDEEQRGVIIIDYVGVCFRSSVRSELYYFDVLVGDTWEYYQGEIANSRSIISKNTKIYAPDRPNYQVGFSLYATAPITYEFKANGVPATLLTKESRFLYTVTETMRLEMGNTLNLKHDINSIVGIKYKGVELPYTLNGRVVHLSLQSPHDYQNGFEVTYNFNSYRYDIGGTAYLGDVTMTINDNIILTLFSSNQDDIKDVPVAYPAAIPIDIASELGRPIHEVVGRFIGVSLNNATITTEAVDKYGYVHPKIPSEGTYDVNVSSIDKTATMQILAKCPGA